MTGEDLYRIGEENAQIKQLIPKGLIQSLPRLELANGKPVLQFWYFYIWNLIPLPYYEPLFYVEVDVETQQVVAYKSFTEDTEFKQSFLDRLFPVSYKKEREYLQHCVQLLEQKELSEEEIIESQAMWLDVQAGSVTHWAQMCSGIRAEAMHKLLSCDSNCVPRNLATIWKNEMAWSHKVNGTCDGEQTAEYRNEVSKFKSKDFEFLKYFEDLQCRCAERPQEE